MKKFWAVLFALALGLVVLAGCAPTEEGPVEKPTAKPTLAPSNTPLPDITVDCDENLFVMDGVTLKAYIGNETNVTVPNGTIIIDKNAFRNCTTIETISIPDSVVIINEYAFAGCTNLQSVNVPKMVTTLGDFCFRDCSSLTKVETKTNTINLGIGLFANCGKLETVVLSNALTYIPEGAFYECSSLKNVTMTGVVEIRKMGFYGCSSLEGITATALSKINDYAFANCTSFTAGDKLANTITFIGRDVFENTPWLKSVVEAANAPKTNKDAYVTIGKGVLVYYSNVHPEGTTFNEGELTFETNVKVISAGSVDTAKDSTTKIVTTTSVISIGDGAFADFDKLESVEFGTGITNLPNNLFKDCDNLKSVVLLGKVEKIGDSAFEGCSALEAVSSKTADKYKPEDGVELNAHGLPFVVDLSNAPDYIGNNAFAGCTAIKEIKLSKNLISIGGEAFFGCSLIDNVETFDKLTFVGADAFAGTTWYDSFKGTEDSNLLIVGDGVLIKAVDFDYAKIDNTINVVSTELTGLTSISEKLFYNNTQIRELIIPESVTSIADYAFYYATNLEYVVIPNSVKSIGQYAFYGCEKLKSVILPESITEISDYCFYGCSSLTSIEIPASVNKIGKYAFYNCVNLENVTVNENVKAIGEFAFTGTKFVDLNAERFLVIGDGLLISYFAFTADDTIPSNVKAIVGGAFNGTYRLKNLTVPASINEINAYAFSGCQSLETINSNASVVCERAFNNCKNLKETKFASGANIAADAFMGCVNLA